jgi:hypothetical protein
MTKNERFGLVFANTGSINSGTAQIVTSLQQGFLKDSTRKVTVLTPR